MYLFVLNEMVIRQHYHDQLIRLRNVVKETRSFTHRGKQHQIVYVHID